MTACIAIAEAGIYSNDIDKNVVVSNNYIDSKEEQAPEEIFTIEEYKETEQTEIIEEVQEISEVKENGTYTISANPELYTLCRVVVGYRGAYTNFRSWGAVGDNWALQTEDGTLRIEQTSETQITVSGAGANSHLRQITAYTNCVFG